MRRVVFALAGCLSVTPLFGQEAVPEAGRYAISANGEGFVRLDTESGAISHCDLQDGVWYCAPLIDDPSAVDRQLGLLSEQVSELSRQIGLLAEDLDTLQGRIEAAETAESPAIRRPARDGPQAPGFAEQVMRRLFDLVREIKLEEANSS
jgi:hypothetical protein